ncbi:hypothetical protein FA15DRAFT_753524 [Coprinopsis marcescibilis]|uniref:G domain-containing protein n=1 Tax=Coprinopsis marcescibilis TaxID=230819 RepID=A0A5C3L5W1_COPMA|nr:hypothetical protein FA15DRAFT_753524 [Coprinopsis marcescibilis]
MAFTRDSDQRLTRYDNGDALILVIGPSGAGKSTFINNYAKEPVAKVTEGYSACTEAVEAFTGKLPLASGDISSKKQLVLVDTPGFLAGDGIRDESKPLKQIAEWLRPKHGPPRLLTGIIYLHDMSVKTIHNEIRMTLSIFRQICGQDAVPMTILVKSHWSADEGCQKRSDALNSGFFSALINAGVESMDIKGDTTEETVIRRLLEKDTRKSLIQLQRELEEGKKIPRTAAGKELKRALEELVRSAVDSKSRSALKKAIKELEPTLARRIQAKLGWGDN